MKERIEKSSFKCRYDFEAGYLVKSPCKSCDIRELFPKCMNECEMLDKIHRILVDRVSCTRER